MKKSIQTQILLISPSEKVRVPCSISYDDSTEEFYPRSEISVIYNGVNYQGYGTDYLLTDTWADLQKKLPQGVKIACCMTCRHGNMCPFGTDTNELFCTKDLTITCKGDMVDLFGSNDTFDERSVTAYGVCDDFVYQSNDYYTYNDYLYQLDELNK